MWTMDIVGKLMKHRVKNLLEGQKLVLVARVPQSQAYFVAATLIQT